MDRELFDKDFFEKLKTLKFGGTMRLSAGRTGARKSTAKGNSVEFSDFREYIPGDDTRRVDWNVYGRTEKLYIRQYMEEKEGLYQIFIDTSRSMACGTPEKGRMALQMAGAFSYIVLNNLDRVYITQMKEHAQERGKGVAGKQAFPYVLNELSRIHFDGKTTLARSILCRPVPIGGTSIIISDFLDPAGIEAAVRYLAYRKQTMIFVRILSPEEVHPDYEGTINLVDIETDDRVKITMTRQALRAYRERLAAQEAALQKLSMKYGASLVTLRTDEPLAAAMLHGLSGVLAVK